MNDRIFPGQLRSWDSIGGLPFLVISISQEKEGSDDWHVSILDKGSMYSQIALGSVLAWSEPME